MLPDDRPAGGVRLDGRLQNPAPGRTTSTQVLPTPTIRYPGFLGSTTTVQGGHEAKDFLDGRSDRAP